MADPPTDPAPLARKDTAIICGVDRGLVEQFLVMVRDNYPKADRSSFFLEEVAGTSYTLSMANLRDVLSHLATLLAEDTPPEEWEAQLASAEEHFRRAIQEPYAIALGVLRERFNGVYSTYQKILPHIRKMQGKGLFQDAPTDRVIQGRLRAIAQLATAGRAAKRRNRIDPDWDHGVGEYAEAYDKLLALTQELSGHIHQHEASREQHIGKVWTIGGAIGTVALGALSILLILFPSFTARIQDWLGIARR
jgi:hypothetical protein